MAAYNPASRAASARSPCPASVYELALQALAWLFLAALLAGFIDAIAGGGGMVTIPAMLLAGIPPLSGFWAKIVLVKASLDASAWIAAAVALLTGIFTLLSMSKIWNEAFLKPHPGGDGGLRSVAGLRPAVWAVSALAAMTVAIGLLAGPVMDYASAAAEQLTAPRGYIDAVLGTPAR